MKSIAIGTFKGGTGKTSTTFNLIGMLAKKKYKVLAIDCDPQANLTNDFDFGESIDDYDYLGTIYEKALQNRDISPELVIVKKPLSIMPTVDLLPSHIYLTAAEMQLVSKAARETVLKKYIERHNQFFSKYDYIIFDTAPSLSIVNQNAFVVADSIMLVSDISINGLKGSTKFISEWNNICEDLNIEKNIKGMLVNKYDKRTKLSKEVAEYVRENDMLKELSFDVIIPENIKLKETEMMHSPIPYYDVKNAGYEAYVELVKELKERGIL